MDCQNEVGFYTQNSWREIAKDNSVKISGWIETDSDCHQYCRYLAPKGQEFEFVQINRYMGKHDIYTISHGVINLQDYFKEQIDWILQSYGYQISEYGTYGISAVPILCNQIVGEMIFETYFKNFEEPEIFEDYDTARNQLVRTYLEVDAPYLS